MRSKLRLAASLLATMALVLIAATAIGAANPHTLFTCTKTKNGKTDVKSSVPDSAVAGLTQAGYECVAEAEQGEDEGETPDGGAGNGSTSAVESEPTTEDSFPTVTVQAPPESRSLYCSTNGPQERGNAVGSGVALDLPDSQGALLVEKGLATPGIFYAGIGVSCDVLPGFTYAGVWVDHVGEVVPGVAVYPYYVPTPS